MESGVIYPDSRLMKKFFIEAALIYGLPVIGILILLLVIMASKGLALADRPVVVFLSVLAISSAVIWVMLAVLIPKYFRSISYELTDKDVVVRKGILTRVTKTIPYRTITNIVEARDLIDRYVVDLGSVQIQTAGMSGTAGYEATLGGLDDWEAVHGQILEKLRRFRGSMSPAAADSEADAPAEPVFERILAELQAIRRIIEKKP